MIRRKGGVRCRSACRVAGEDHRHPARPDAAAAGPAVPRRLGSGAPPGLRRDPGPCGDRRGRDRVRLRRHHGRFRRLRGPVPRPGPGQIARHVRTLETIGFHASRYWPLEAALWDIAGKVAGLPVAALFGGAETKIPAYASFGEVIGPAQRADAVIAAARGGVPRGEDPDRPQRRGLRAWPPCGPPGRRPVTRSRSSSTSTRAGACPGTSRPRSTWRAVTALAGELRDLGVLWLEEPLPGRGHRRHADAAGADRDPGGRR